MTVLANPVRLFAYVRALIGTYVRHIVPLFYGVISDAREERTLHPNLTRKNKVQAPRDLRKHFPNARKNAENIAYAGRFATPRPLKPNGYTVSDTNGYEHRPLPSCIGLKTEQKRRLSCPVSCSIRGLIFTG